MEGIATRRKLECAGVTGILELLSVVIDRGHGIVAAGIAGEGHGIFGVLPGFIGIDLCCDRSCIALRGLTGNAQIAVQRRLVFLRCGILHVGVFRQIVRHDLHQGLQAGGRCAVRGFTKSEMRHRIGCAVKRNTLRRTAVGIVAVDTLDRRNKAAAVAFHKVILACIQRLPDGLAVHKGDPRWRNEQLIL